MSSKEGGTSAVDRQCSSDRNGVSRRKGGKAADLNSHSQVTPFAATRKIRDHWSMTWLVQRALQSGGIRVSPIRVEWDISGNCTDTYWRELYSPPPATDGKYVLQTKCKKHSWILDLGTRCRRCERCRKQRAAVWRCRAERETRAAPRTWFATFTLRPDRHAYYEARAILKAREEGKTFEALTEGERFVRRHAEISPAFTLMFKRLRKNTGVPFKYLLVAEAHKSGLPHYHALIHERNINKMLRYSALKPLWSEGFSQFKLVSDVKQATYLCKYLSKDMHARVRASVRYGKSEGFDSDDLSVIGYFGNNRVTKTPSTKRGKSVF